MPTAKKPKADEASKKAPAKRVKKNLGAPVNTDPVPPKMKIITLTQEHFEEDPTLAEEGFAVGDTVEVEDEGSTEEEKAALKKNEIAKVSKNATAVDIIKGTEYIRTYSEDDHGDDFMKLAEQFKGKKEEYAIVDSEGIRAVIVPYKAVDKKTGATYRTEKVFTSANGTENQFKKDALHFKNTVLGDYVLIKR